MCVFFLKKIWAVSPSYPFHSACIHLTWPQEINFFFIIIVAVTCNKCWVTAWFIGSCHGYLPYWAIIFILPSVEGEKELPWDLCRKYQNIMSVHNRGTHFFFSRLLEQLFLCMLEVMQNQITKWTSPLPSPPSPLLRPPLPSSASPLSPLPSPLPTLTFYLHLERIEWLELLKN